MGILCIQMPFFLFPSAVPENTSDTEYWLCSAAVGGNGIIEWLGCKGQFTPPGLGFNSRIPLEQRLSETCCC